MSVGALTLPVAPALQSFRTMHDYRRVLITSLAVLVIVSLPSAVYAGAPTEALKQTVDQVIKIMADPALADKPDVRRTQIRKVAENIFDYQDTARRALGQHWSARTPQQQQEFVKLFADLLDRSYISKIEVYHGERVKYVGESIDGQESVVKTLISTKQGSDVPVDYRMHLQNGRWLVYDVIIEGVSLVSNYRTQFNKIVQTESYEALVQRLRAKEGPEPAASPARKRGER